MEVERYTYANVTQRFLAVAVDFVVMLVVGYPTAVLVIRSVSWIAPYVAALVVFTLYEPVLHAIYGQPKVVLSRIRMAKVLGRPAQFAVPPIETEGANWIGSVLTASRHVSRLPRSLQLRRR